MEAKNHSPTTTTDAQVIEKVEGFIAYGAPTCDVCRDIPREERHDDAEFWPDQAIHYVVAHKRAAHEWWGTTVCDHHDTDEHQPDEATHRVVDEPFYVGDDPDRMNSAYKHDVVRVTQL